MEKKTEGAWLIHHTNKLGGVTKTTGFSEVEAAGKAGMLLSLISESTQQATLSKEKLEIIASASGINKAELKGLLLELKENRLIDISAKGEVATLGLSTTAILGHTSNIFHSYSPSSDQEAVLFVSELVSKSPVNSKELLELVGDTYKLTSQQSVDLIDISDKIGFIDAEEVDKSNKIYFNGNLFKVDNAKKTSQVLQSLTETDKRNVVEVESKLKESGCLLLDEVVRILGGDLYKKLHSIGMYDVNSVNNASERAAFVTSPAAFNKYASYVDDAFDLAKVLITSLTYGMTKSPYNRGKIQMLGALMSKLIAGFWVGPATAIGQDYKALELKRVVELKKEPTGNLYKMRLLKKEVGELALLVLTSGDASENSLSLPNASVDTYTSPEKNREVTRRNSVTRNNGAIVDMLRTIQ